MRDLSEEEMERIYHFKEHTSNQPAEDPFNERHFSGFFGFEEGAIQRFLSGPFPGLVM